jgi:quinol monooxygenase YgiN
MFALVVRFDFRSEEAAALFDSLTRRVVQQVTANEPGTLLYVAHTIAGEPLARLFYEAYVDADAFRTHGETEHVRAFLEARGPLIAGRRVEYLTPVAAKGFAARGGSCGESKNPEHLKKRR